MPQAMQRTTSKIQIPDSQKTAEVESDSKFQKKPVQKTIAVESEPVIEQQIDEQKVAAAAQDKPKIELQI